MITVKQLRKAQRNEKFYTRYKTLTGKGLSHYKACEEIHFKMGGDLSLMAVIQIIKKMQANEENG